jgi:hypothetical protein
MPEIIKLSSQWKDHEERPEDDGSFQASKVYKEIWVSLKTTSVPRGKLDLDYFLIAIYLLKGVPNTGGADSKV